MHADAYALAGACFVWCGRLVLASDGLWDVLDAEEVAPLLETVPRGADAGEMAQALRDEAFARGSADNISVVVLCLRTMRECSIGAR